MCFCWDGEAGNWCQKVQQEHYIVQRQRCLLEILGCVPLFWWVFGTGDLNPPGQQLFPFHFFVFIFMVVTWLSLVNLTCSKFFPTIFSRIFSPISSAFSALTSSEAIRPLDIDLSLVSAFVKGFLPTRNLRIVLISLLSRFCRVGLESTCWTCCSEES